MKKVILSLVALLMSASVAMAEKGDKSVGLSIGVAPNLSNVKATNVGTELGGVICKAPGANFGFALKFDYNYTDNIRLEAALEEWVRSNDHSMLDICVNAHYLIDVMPALKVYPLLGVGYGREKITYTVTTFDGDNSPISGSAPVFIKDDFHQSCNRFIFNVGVGGDYKLTDKLTANLELRYMYVNHFDKFPITVGVRYAF